MVTEPGAVVGPGAILSGQVLIKNRVFATVITGGNVDPERFARLVR
jgi:threonine dehydratase